MKKKIRIFAVVALLATVGAACVFFVNGYAQKQSSEPAILDPSAEPSPDKTIEPPRAFGGLPAAPSVSLSLADEGGSLGEQAGLAVRDLNRASEDTYQAFNQETAKKMEQLRTVTDDAIKVFQAQMDKSMKDFDAVVARIQKSMNREAEKFRQTVNAPKPSAPAPDSQGSRQTS